jgi:hypothetical protein
MSLRKSLSAEDAKKADVQRRLSELDEFTKAVDLDGARLKKVLAKKVADLQGLLAESTPRARQALRKVLVEGRLRCEPLQDGRRGYRFFRPGKLR